MEAMLWRALSFTAWSFNSSHKRLSTRTEGRGGACCRGSTNETLNNTLKAPLTFLTTVNSKQVKRSSIGIAMLRRLFFFLKRYVPPEFQYNAASTGMYLNESLPAD